MCAFFTEGIKVLFNMGYAFFKFYKDNIIEAKTLNELIYKVKKRCNELNEADKTQLRYVNFDLISSYFSSRALAI